MSLFCRHNRFVADCPICSKGTPLEQGRRVRRQPAGERAAQRAKQPAAPLQFSGPHAGAGPYEDAGGMRYEVRLERVPGGVRLGEWSGSRLRRRAPVLALQDLPGLIADAAEVVGEPDAAALAGSLAGRPDAVASIGAPGVSRGRSGDFKEELRVEALDGGRVRIARFVLRPGAGWQRQDAPPMLPAARFAEALADAAAKGVLSGSDPAARP